MCVPVEVGNRNLLPAVSYILSNKSNASLDNGIRFFFRSLLLCGGRFQIPISRSRSSHSRPRTSPRRAPVRISSQELQETFPVLPISQERSELIKDATWDAMSPARKQENRTVLPSRRRVHRSANRKRPEIFAESWCHLLGPSGQLVPAKDQSKTGPRPVRPNQLTENPPTSASCTTISETPLLCFRLAKKCGPSPRMRFASRSITSNEAPT